MELCILTMLYMKRFWCNNVHAFIVILIVTHITVAFYIATLSRLHFTWLHYVSQLHFTSLHYVLKVVLLIAYQQICFKLQYSLYIHCVIARSIADNGILVQRLLPAGLQVSESATISFETFRK